MDSRFEQLRHEFYQRLCADRRQLDILSAELEDMNCEAMPTYDRIRVLAHKICGAAAVYEDADICEAAGALEWAAANALRTGAVHETLSVTWPVRSTIDILSMMLGAATAFSVNERLN